MFILSILLMFHIASLWSELHVIFHNVAWSYYLTVYPCSLCLLPLLFIFVFLCTISLFGRLYARLVGVSLQNFSWKKKKWNDHLVTWCDKKNQQIAFVISHVPSHLFMVFPYLLDISCHYCWFEICAAILSRLVFLTLKINAGMQCSWSLLRTFIWFPRYVFFCMGA